MKAENSAEETSGGTSLIDIDYSEVSGKKVECPPQCGLCCLCQPEVLPEEKQFFKSKYPQALTISECGCRHTALKMKKGHGSCVFLNGRKCDIYQNRTTFCRQFPFHFHVSDRVKVELDLSCRGVWSGNGTDAVAEARTLAAASEKRISDALKEASSVYSEFYSICKESGIYAEPSVLRMSVSENVSLFTSLPSIANILDLSVEEPQMSLSKVIPGKYDSDELEIAAADTALESMSSEDPFSVPVYCDEKWNWNMFIFRNRKIEWNVMDDEGDLTCKGSVDPSEIRLRMPDKSGMEVLNGYVGTLNGRDSFLGSAYYTMDQLGYEDDMSNLYYGSMATTVLDLLWRASLVDHFFQTDIGARGMREAIIFFDMDRLDAPTIGAFV